MRRQIAPGLADHPLAKRAADIDAIGPHQHRRRLLASTTSRWPDRSITDAEFGPHAPAVGGHVDTKIAAVALDMALRRRDRVSRFGSSGQSLWGASQRRERNVDHWLEHGRASMLR